ncbi:MAG TPA: hypothetical protein VFG73_02510 [Rhodanobacteraceae bacterium]|nr:hypothetical protein [Rhodanobacteraceae bacterium]
MAKTAAPTCRLCGKPLRRVGGYLQRVNEKGVPGIFECRPSCDADLPPDTRLLLALDDDLTEGVTPC